MELWGHINSVQTPPSRIADNVLHGRQEPNPAPQHGDTLSQIESPGCTEARSCKRSGTVQTSRPHQAGHSSAACITQGMGLEAMNPSKHLREAVGTPSTPPNVADTHPLGHTSTTERRENLHTILDLVCPERGDVGLDRPDAQPHQHQSHEGGSSAVAGGSHLGAGCQCGVGGRRGAVLYRVQGDVPAEALASVRRGDDGEGQHAQQVECHAEQDGAELAQQRVGQPAAKWRYQVGDAHEEQQGLAGLGALPVVGRPVEEQHQVGGDAVEGHSLQQLGQQHGSASQPPPVEGADRRASALSAAQQRAALARLGLLHGSASPPRSHSFPARPEVTSARSRGGASPDPPASGGRSNAIGWARCHSTGRAVTWEGRPGTAAQEGQRGFRKGWSCFVLRYGVRGAGFGLFWSCSWLCGGFFSLAFYPAAVAEVPGRVKVSQVEAAAEKIDLNVVLCVSSGWELPSGL